MPPTPESALLRSLQGSLSPQNVASAIDSIQRSRAREQKRNDFLESFTKFTERSQTDPEFGKISSQVQKFHPNFNKDPESFANFTSNIGEVEIAQATLREAVSSGLIEQKMADVMEKGMFTDPGFITRNIVSMSQGKLAFDRAGGAASTKLTEQREFQREVKVEQRQFEAGKLAKEAQKQEDISTLVLNGLQGAGAAFAASARQAGIADSMTLAAMKSSASLSSALSAATKAAEGRDAGRGLPAKLQVLLESVRTPADVEKLKREGKVPANMLQDFDKAVKAKFELFDKSTKAKIESIEATKGFNIVRNALVTSSESIFGDAEITEEFTDEFIVSDTGQKVLKAAELSGPEFKRLFTEREELIARVTDEKSQNLLEGQISLRDFEARGGKATEAGRQVLTPDVRFASNLNIISNTDAIAQLPELPDFIGRFILTNEQGDFTVLETDKGDFVAFKIDSPTSRPQRFKMDIVTQEDNRRVLQIGEDLSSTEAIAAAKDITERNFKDEPVKGVTKRLSALDKFLVNFRANDVFAKKRIKVRRGITRSVLDKDKVDPTSPLGALLLEIRATVSTLKQFSSARGKVGRKIKPLDPTKREAQFDLATDALLKSIDFRERLSAFDRNIFIDK